MVYIYSTDKYGNPGPYTTSKAELERDIAEILEIKHFELTENVNGDLYDKEGEKVAELATPDVIACYNYIDDPMGLL